MVFFRTYIYTNILYHNVIRLQRAGSVKFDAFWFKKRDKRGCVFLGGGIAGEGDKSLYCFIRHPSLHGIGLCMGGTRKNKPFPKTERLVTCFVVLLFPCENSAFGKRDVFADRVFFGNGI